MPGNSEMSVLKIKTKRKTEQNRNRFYSKSKFKSYFTFQRFLLENDDNFW